jgi:hypothetical protein
MTGGLWIDYRFIGASLLKKTHPERSDALSEVLVSRGAGLSKMI